MNLQLSSTRLLEPAYIQQAAQQGIQLECAAFLEIDYLPPAHFQENIATYQGPLIFTSIHALKAIQTVLPVKQACFFINGNTSRFGLELGLHVAGDAPDAEALAQLIIQQQVKAVLHCNALDRRPELGNVLREQGIIYQELTVYQKKTLQVKLHPRDGILFYSPSQVRAFLACNELIAGIPAFCIGKTTAAVLQVLGHHPIIIAKSSNTNSLLEAVFQYFELNHE